MIEIYIHQNVHDGSFSCQHAFNNKIEKIFADDYVELVNKIEDKMREVFDHAFNYRIIEERFLPT